MSVCLSVVQIGLICYVAKNDPELSIHPPLLANYGKDADNGWVKDWSSFLIVYIKLAHSIEQLWSLLCFKCHLKK